MGTKERCMFNCGTPFKATDTVTQLEDGSIIHDSCMDSEALDLFGDMVYKRSVNYGSGIHRDWK